MDDIRIDVTETVQRALLELGPRALKIARMAGAGALRSMRAEASRGIRAQIPLKRKYMNRVIVTRSPRSGSELAWYIWATRALIPMSALPHRQTRAGVSVELAKGTRTVERGAFVATMKSGHEGIFRRATKKRLPIEQLYTSSIFDLFQSMTPAIKAKGNSVFLSTFYRLLDVELKQMP